MHALETGCWRWCQVLAVREVETGCRCWCCQLAARVVETGRRCCVPGACCERAAHVVDMVPVLGGCWAPVLVLVL